MRPMKQHSDDGDTPLNGTLRFVLVMGFTFAALWLLMYWFMLISRW